MTYTAISAAAKTGLTNQSRLPVKKALAVAPALKLVSALALSQSLPRPKVSHPTPQPSFRFSYHSLSNSSNHCSNRTPRLFDARLPPHQLSLSVRSLPQLSLCLPRDRLSPSQSISRGYVHTLSLLLFHYIPQQTEAPRLSTCTHANTSS
jgi:hypothetical protein